MRIAKFLALVFSIGLVSCSQYGKVLKKGTKMQKYKMAKELYMNKSYAKALLLWEDLIQVNKFQDSAEQVFYYYAYSHYGLGDNFSAAHYFKSYANKYRNSSKRQEMLYMWAKSLMLNSNPSYLDQEDTYRAIEAFQLFVNEYPNSEKYVELSNQNIDKLRKKLYTKAFDNAKQYLKQEYFKAAIVSFQNLMVSYPDVDNKEEIDFLIVKSAHLLAKNSTDNKKQTRLNKVVTYFENYIKGNGTNGEFYEKALKYKNQAQKNLNLF